MRFLGRIVAVAAVLAVIAVERSEAGSGAGSEAGSEAGIAGIGLGLLGALAGLLAALAGLQLGMLAGASAFGARVHRVVIGFGRLWQEWRTPRRAIVLRGFPVLLSLSVGPGRAPVRLRLWLSALSSALLGVAVVVSLWIAAGGSFGRGAAIGATATMVHALVPRRSAASTSTGWQLVGLPLLPAAEVAELTAAGLADEALTAVNAGDLTTADAVVERLVDQFSGLRCAGTTRVAVLEAHGRYAEALSVVLELVSDATQAERDMAFMLAGLAGIGAAAVEAGEVPADAVLPLARQAVTDAERLGFPSFKLNGTRAQLALLDGDTARATTLARSAVSVADHALSRADDLATLARALMASGDNHGARAALAKAEAIAPWWPRVATTRTRLNIT